MSEFVTKFGSLNDYEKGWVRVIEDDPRHYAFSNVFEVAENSAPYERVVVAKNLQYVLETASAEGTSPWFATAHDEFAIVLDGDVDIHYVKPDDPASAVPADQEGAVKVGDQAPAGKRMGVIHCQRGHQALLPKNTAYQFQAKRLSVVLIQTIQGDVSVEKWAEICER